QGSRLTPSRRPGDDKICIWDEQKSSPGRSRDEEDFFFPLVKCQLSRLSVRISLSLANGARLLSARLLDSGIRPLHETRENIRMFNKSSRGTGHPLSQGSTRKHVALFEEDKHSRRRWRTDTD
ncbi:hypothetical protein AAFF_G00148200, partial [Aldrovandia affinis]